MRVSEFESSQKKVNKQDLASYNRQLEDDMQREQERHKRNLDALGKRKEDMVREKKQKLKVGIGRTMMFGKTVLYA